MSGELWALLIASGVVPVLGALALWLRARAARLAKDDERVVVRQDDSTGAEDTDRFLVALKNAKKPELEEFIREIRKSNAQEPATRADVQEAVRSEVDRLEQRIDGKLAVYSGAIADLRTNQDRQEGRFNDLPCQRVPSECPYSDGGDDD